MENLKLRMGELTGGEARVVLARRPVILLPMGSHEDQGPYAPMGDYLSAEKVALQIAAAARDAGTETLVAPVLPFGGADFFGTMPGGIALSQATIRSVIGDMLACLLRHDLSRIIVINGHGGNSQAIHDVTQEVYRARGVLVPSFYLWRVAAALLPGIVEPEVAQRSSGHGANPLGSVAMHLFPDLVRMDMVPAPNPPPKVLGLDVSNFGSVLFEGVEVQVPVELDEIAPNGVFADATHVSAGIGAQLTARLVEAGARFVAHYAGAVR